MDKEVCGPLLVGKDTHVHILGDDDDSLYFYLVERAKISDQKIQD